MKRHLTFVVRKPNRQLFELLIVSVLDRTIPRNIEDVRRLASEKIGRDVSWNTVQKYLMSLRDIQRVEEIHSGKLVLYRLR